MKTIREQALGTQHPYQNLTVPECQGDFPKCAPGWFWVHDDIRKQYEVWCNGSGLYQGTLEQMAERTWQLWEERSNLTREWYERAEQVLAQGSVDTGFLKEGAAAAHELAWAIEQNIPRLEKHPEEIGETLGHFRSAALEMKEAFQTRLRNQED